jgi:hypothetical protein
MENHLIPNEAITATSWVSVGTNPSQARLHNTYGHGAWCSKLNDPQQFLEIKLSRLHRISRVATQGRFPVPGCEVGDAWVTQYSIEYSVDGYSWQFYKESGVNKVSRDYIDDYITAQGMRNAISSSSIKLVRRVAFLHVSGMLKLIISFV